jgi:transposase InsO family protein
LADYRLAELCSALEIAPSGYYQWRKCKQSLRAQEDERLLHKIREIHHAKRARYGSPRVHAELKEAGERCSRKRVARLMRLNGIAAKHKRKFKATTDSGHKYAVAPNLLEQNFKASEPNRVWTADITYCWTFEGWMYLAVVMDIYSRKIVGWAMSERMTRDLVIQAFVMAYKARNPSPGLIHHSDKGSQYASDDFKSTLSAFGVRQSMSGKGNCYDNAVTETFFHTLKTELMFDCFFRTREEARSAVFEYIEAFYNRDRRHSTLGYCSPVKFEQYYAELRNVA